MPGQDLSAESPPAGDAGLPAAGATPAQGASGERKNASTKSKGGGAKSGADDDEMGGSSS